MIVKHLPVAKKFEAENEMAAVLESMLCPTGKSFLPPINWLARVDFPTPVGPSNKILGCGSSTRSEQRQGL